jgi:peptide/nickel transport system substrate-binding protein
VRRALDLAVDREAILQQGLRGRGIPASGPVWPRHWAYDATLPAARYNPGEAVTLLDEALGPTRATPGPGAASRLQFTCLIPVNFTLYERIALLVQKQLWDVNVDMRLEAVRPDVFNGRIRSGDFDAVVLPIAGGPFLGLFHRFWHSPDPRPRWNYWHYADAQVDVALEALRDARDEAAMRDAVGRMTRAMRADPPALFLVWGETTQAYSRRFDVPVEPGRDALANIGGWRPTEAREASR